MYTAMCFQCSFTIITCHTVSNDPKPWLNSNTLCAILCPPSHIIQGRSSNNRPVIKEIDYVPLTTSISLMWVDLVHKIGLNKQKQALWITAAFSWVLKGFGENFRALHDCVKEDDMEFPFLKVRLRQWGYYLCSKCDKVFLLIFHRCCDCRCSCPMSFTWSSASRQVF